MRTSGFLLVIVLGLGLPAAGCGGNPNPSAGSTATTAASLSPLCQPRVDEVTPACFAEPTATICSPSGCQSLCAARLTPVTCFGADPGSIPIPIRPPVAQSSPSPRPRPSCSTAVLAAPGEGASPDRSQRERRRAAAGQLVGEPEVHALIARAALQPQSLRAVGSRRRAGLAQRRGGAAPGRVSAGVAGVGAGARRDRPNSRRPWERWARTPA